ncbi:MAG: electron transfer flavoprotein subunit alpha/FixB family protein [Synergistaceae bacterium]|jgi:electron transfer flavoprotein alpha subunit|nr:electron transfer flavoprotein subunit alpha/FixB family protein [Synergistaceae bacterium]
MIDANRGKNIAANEVWVLGEGSIDGGLSDTVFELSLRARSLADALENYSGERHTVSVILPLDSGTADLARPEEAGRAGADRVVVIKSEGLVFDRAACGKTIAHMAKSSPNGVPKIFIASATAFGRSVMPYAAALLETGLTADCTGLEIDPKSGLLLQTRPAIGGNIMATIKTPNHRPQMATVRPGTFPMPRPDARGHAKVSEFAIPEHLSARTVETVAFSPYSREEGTLKDRDVVISAGRGLRRPEGFKLIARLASLLGAGVGASRPAVEMKWIGYPHQVGLSGQTISPKVYIAAGISGSVQHLAGIQTSGTIIAINRDPEARIFGVSDVAICGDLYEALPKLIERIEAKMGR